MICSLCGKQTHWAYNCPLNKTLGGVVLTAISLAGCATTPVPPSELPAPPARLMASPAPLPRVVVGNDLVAEDLKLRSQYSRETSRLRSLQSYVRAMRGER